MASIDAAKVYDIFLTSPLMLATQLCFQTLRNCEGGIGFKPIPLFLITIFPRLYASCDLLDSQIGKSNGFYPVTAFIVFSYF